LTHITENESDIRDVNVNHIKLLGDEKNCAMINTLKCIFWLVTENEKEMKTKEKFTFSSCLDAK